MDRFSSLVIFCFPLLFSPCKGCFTWNRYMQTCINCKATMECGTITAARLVSTADECKYWCLLGRSSCEMARYKGTNCMMFAQFHCDSVEQETGETVFRQACPSDCLEYSLSSWYRQKGTCGILNGTNGFNHTRTSCLSLCLDTEGCRGSTYWMQSGLCELHTCDSMTNSDNTYFTSRICFDDTSSTRQVTSSKLLSSVSTTSSSSSFRNTLSSYFELTGGTGLFNITPVLTPSLQLITVQTTSNLSESSPSSTVMLTTSDTAASSIHKSTGFLTQPSNIAAVSLTGGIATAGILTTAACKLLKKKSV